MRTALALPILVAALLPVSAASAQGSDLAAAQSLFDGAKQLVGQGRLAEACPKFLASFRLDPKPGTAVNLADCYEKTGQIASAWARYQEAESLAQRAGQAERAHYARERAAALEPRVSRLTISAPSAPPGLEVLRGGVAVDAAIFGMAVAVDPGKLLIEARAPGRAPWSKTIEVTPGTPQIAVEIPALQAAPTGSAPSRIERAGGSPPGASTGAPPSGPFWGTRRVAGAAVGGVGVAGVVAGSVLGALTLAKLSASRSQGHCNAGLTICDSTGLQMQQDARGLAHGSTAALAVGGAALVAGVVLIATGGPATPAKAGARLTVGPVAGVDLKGALLRGEW